MRLQKLSIDFHTYFALDTPEGDAAPEALLVVLHGYGQRCEPFLRQFAPLKQRNVLLVAPQAPSAFYWKLETGIVGFSWVTRYERDTAMQDVIGYLDRLLETLEASHGIDRKRIFLLGFSQGVSIAYRYALWGEYPVAGLIACSADLPADVETNLSAELAWPVFLAHGWDDTIVPFAKAEAAQRTLQAHGFPLETYFFPGGHVIPGELMPRIGDWIAGRLAGNLVEGQNYFF